MSVSHKGLFGRREGCSPKHYIKTGKPCYGKYSRYIQYTEQTQSTCNCTFKNRYYSSQGEKVTFDIASYVDDKGNPIIDVQWEGRTPNDRYRGGMHTIRARVKNNLGLWSDWSRIYI